MRAHRGVFVRRPARRCQSRVARSTAASTRDAISCVVLDLRVCERGTAARKGPARRVDRPSRLPFSTRPLSAVAGARVFCPRRSVSSRARRCCAESPGGNLDPRLRSPHEQGPWAASPSRVGSSCAPRRRAPSTVLRWSAREARAWRGVHVEAGVGARSRGGGAVFRRARAGWRALELDGGEREWRQIARGTPGLASPLLLVVSIRRLLTPVTNRATGAADRVPLHWFVEGAVRDVRRVDPRGRASRDRKFVENTNETVEISTSSECVRTASGSTVDLLRCCVSVCAVFARLGGRLEGERGREENDRTPAGASDDRRSAGFKDGGSA